MLVDLNDRILKSVMDSQMVLGAMMLNINLHEETGEYIHNYYLAVV